MGKHTFTSSQIFKSLAYILLAAGSFVLIRYYIKPKAADPVAIRDLRNFVQQAIFESDQKLKRDFADDDISSWVSWYKSSAALYNQAKVHQDKGLRAQSQVLKEKLSSVQTKSFPKQRASYAQSKLKVLATKEIDIETSGKANDILLLSGDIFESKRAQNEFMKRIDQVVKDLRFHRVVFKWSEYGSHHRDYEISSKMDSEI
jgi:hypothetical protein